MVFFYEGVVDVFFGSAYYDQGDLNFCIVWWREKMEKSAKIKGRWFTVKYYRPTIKWLKWYQE